MNYRFAFSVQYPLSAAASTHQLSGNEISSLALVRGLLSVWVGGRLDEEFESTLGEKKVHGGGVGMCSVIFEDTGLFTGKSMVGRVCLSPAFVS